MKFQPRLFILLLLLPLICSGLEKRPSIRPVSIVPDPVRTFENGKLFKMSGNGNEHFKVASLKGSWREMGRQYGYLLKGQMDEFYKIEKTWTKESLERRKALLLAAERRTS